MVVLRAKEEKRGGLFTEKIGSPPSPLSSSLVLAERAAEESFFMSGSVNIAHTLRDIHHATKDSVSLNGGAARLVCVG